MSAFIALSLSTYMVLTVLASYLNRTVSPFALIILLAGSAIFSLFLVRMSKETRADEAGAARLASRRWQPAGLTVLLVALAFLPGILALLLSTRVQISVHGFFHSAYTYQILHGIIPPENVSLPGYPVNNYWPYHAILAVFSQILNAPPPLASAWLNLLSLLASLALSYQLIRLLLPRTGVPAGISLAIVGLFGMNLFGAFHTWVDGDQDYLRPAVLMGDYRVAHVVDKFLNFSGFAVGIMLYLYVLVILAGVITKRRFSRYDFISLSLAGLGTLLVHATTGLFMAVVLPAALLGVYLIHLRRTRSGTLLQAILMDAGNNARHLRSPVPILILALTGVAAVASLYSLYQTSTALPVKSEIDWFSLYDVQSMLGVIYPLLPFFVMSMVWAWRRGSLPVLWLGFTYLLGSGLALATALPDGNDYKFIVLATIPACFAAAYALADFARMKRLRLFAPIVIALALANILMVGLFRLQMDWFTDRTFRYDGQHVNADVQRHADIRDLRYADLYRWAREATPVNTVIIAPRIYKDKSALFILSERVPYVVDADIFNRLPEKRARVEQIEELYKSSVDEAEKLAIIQSIREELPDRPILLIFPLDIDQPPPLEKSEPGIFRQGELAYAYLFPALEP